MGPRWPQDRSKTSPRAIKKSCIFCLDFCLVLGSSWGRFGTHFGLQHRPQKFGEIHPEGSGFRSCDRFDFGLDFGLVLGPFWACLGCLLGPFWFWVAPKKHLEAVFVKKSMFAKHWKADTKTTLVTPRWAHDGLKTGPRQAQERSKSSACFVLNFDSFGGRLGVVLGPIWAPKSTHKLSRD